MAISDPQDVRGHTVAAAGVEKPLHGLLELQVQKQKRVLEREEAPRRCSPSPSGPTLSSLTHLSRSHCHRISSLNAPVLPTTLCWMLAMVVASFTISIMPAWKNNEERLNIPPRRHVPPRPPRLKCPTYSVPRGDAAVRQEAEVQGLGLPDGLHDQQDLRRWGGEGVKNRERERQRESRCRLFSPAG